jgi:hypothetical protein
MEPLLTQKSDNSELVIGVTISKAVQESFVSSPTSSFVREKQEMQKYYDNFNLIESEQDKIDYVTKELRYVFKVLLGTQFDEESQKAAERTELPILLYQIKTVVPYIVEDAGKWHQYVDSRKKDSKQGLNSHRDSIMS